ncbi:pumilio domain member 6 [Serendipita sp. 405]|nr:pumilio domain member 6 [Serendipita sp. 397]KAG8804555.1 pumilio domain member 6 [Serendipita sp. 398]KAG8878674.1 pumilio domain member 6 [Serendipita sp. 405]
MKQANSRKRPSAHQGGKDPKRQNVLKETPKRKSVPVTATQDEIEESGDESSQSYQEEEEELVDEMEKATVHEASGSKGAAFESHKAQKELLAQRKASKPNAEMVTEAKKLWNSARQRNLSKQEREVICKKLSDTVRGKIAEIASKHDSSRIIQTLVKYGRQQERDLVASELKGHYKALAQSKYSKFLVLKLIRYCPKHRSSLLSEFHGNVLRLLLHREAGHVISEAFELYSNANERSMLLREFYGKEVALFEPKKEGKQGIRGVLDGLEKERQRRILSSLKENIQSVFENSDKGAVSRAIVHAALWEYLSEIELLDDKSEAERLRREIYEICQESVAEMVHTRYGSQSARYFLAYGTAKDRKQITKLLKPHLERICLDSEAQLVLFTLLDVTDDTKLLSKSILADLAALAPKLYMDANGRRALLYPLIYRSSRHITPAMATVLAYTDPIRATTSKKDEELRREEVRKAFSGDILKQVEMNAAKMILDTGGSLLITEVLLCADGDKLAAIDAVLRPLQSPFPGSKEHKHPVELSHTARMLKQLLQGGHWSHATKAVIRSEHFDAAVFASAFLRIVGDDDGGERIRKMAQGDGTFVIAELCERIDKEGSAEDKKKLKNWFSGDVVKSIKSQDIRGGGVLLEKLVALKA